MALGTRSPSTQPELFVAAAHLQALARHPFYTRLNQLLDQLGFDARLEELCAPFYSDGQGRPGVPPGAYFRMLMVGYFEGIESERGIEWRCKDSFSLREFLRVGIDGRVPDHSSLSRIRQRLPVELHHEVFAWVLQALEKNRLLKGKRLGVDSTTLEANAAMKSIVRRDSGEAYSEFLKGLAVQSGIETPTKEDLARLDRKRARKGSNEDWTHPQDPDAGITKMKDGSTHLAHKVEHAVDLDSGAIVAVNVQPPQVGDTQSGPVTLEAAVAQLEVTIPETRRGTTVCVAMDKGYHSNGMLEESESLGVRTYASEPARGRRNWKGRPEDCRRVYANRRRVRSARGRQAMKDRAEKVERSFQHCYDRGGLRRLWVRGQEKITKRVLVGIAAFNLGLLMRKLFHFGTPKGLMGALFALMQAWKCLRCVRLAFWRPGGEMISPANGFCELEELGPGTGAAFA